MCFLFPEPYVQCTLGALFCEKAKESSACRLKPTFLLLSAVGMKLDETPMKAGSSPTEGEPNCSRAWSMARGKEQWDGEASELWWSMFCSHPPARGACVHPSELLNVGQAYMQSNMKSISAAWSKILVAGQRRSIPDAGDVIHKFSTADSIQWCRTAIPKYNAAEGLWHVWLANVLFNSCTVCSPALVN